MGDSGHWCLAWIAVWGIVVCPVQGVSAAEPSVGYAAIQRAFLREDFTEVTSLAQTFILQNPDQPEVPRVWLWLALSLDRLQESSEALREIDRLKNRLHPRDPLWSELLFWEGDISRRAFQMTRARSAYEQLLQRFPNSTWTSQAQLGLGLIDLHQQAFASAVDHFHAVSSKQGQSSAVLDALVFEGLSHLQLKQFQKAVAVFEPLLGKLPESGIAQAAFYLGESLSGLGRYDEAVATYTRAIASAKTAQWRQPSHFGLGWAYAQLNRCEESVTAFEQYLAAGDPDHRSEALFAQAGCLMKLGREREALARFEQIVSREPDHPLALESAFVIVDAYRKQERFAIAKELLHTFLQRNLSDTANAKIQLRLGSIALEQGNAPQAKTIFMLAAQRDEPPIRQAALNGLGDVELFLGDPTKARGFYEEAIRLSADRALTDYASYQAGRIDLQAGALDAAIDRFRRLAAEEGSGLADDARLALIIAYLNRKDDAQARDTVEAIRRERPDDVVAARAAYYAALLALGEGDEGAVERLCREAITKAPSTSEGFEARLLLADLQARQTSPRQVMKTLAREYESEQLPRSQRAKLAKRIADLARSEGTYPEAITWYTNAGELLPSLNSEASYRIASCYEESGDLEQAIDWYQNVEQAPWRVRGQLAAAKLLERQDRQAEAKAIYERLAGESIPEAGLIKERLVALRAAGNE